MHAEILAGERCCDIAHNQNTAAMACEEGYWIHDSAAHIVRYCGRTQHLNTVRDAHSVALEDHT